MRSYWKRLFLTVFIFVSVLLLIIIVTPLDYYSSGLSWIHFWITVLLGAVVTFQWIRKPPLRALARIWWFTLTPLVFLVFVYSFLFFGTTSRASDTFPVPGTNKVIIHRFYTLPMMGDPRMEIAVGYQFLGGTVLWKSWNSYVKDGMGDGFADIRKYELPDSLYDRESVFVLPEEGLIVDLYYENVYPLRFKKQP